MGCQLKRGCSLYIPFKNGVSIYDSQQKPRMYKTRQAFERSFPDRNINRDSIELVEYAEVQHASWTPIVVSYNKKLYGYRCSRCGHIAIKKYNYCHCGCRMDGEIF